MFRTLALLLMSLLTVSMLAGCGGDDSESEEEVLLANVIGVNPPSGSEIAVNGGITLTFDNTPTDVAVSGYTVTVAGKTATIVGPFRLGPLVLTVTWADGARTLNYTATRPDCCAPLIFIGGTVKDGDTDVDPEAINIDGKIEITFTEEVSGNITLQTEGGDDVGWLGKVEGNKAILQLVKGREVTNEMIYVIVAKVFDALGNEVDIKITFVTKAKA